ncbi:hypothetical protein [Streptomyces spinosisporus]|uniref:Uncharacterized protein n=1 Tax=Streptomyces spinosisporus TaxID=2927582 RepID=A0ABS9XWN3_9ACTN|nr:hypothetical protein [Streptomyces spinosisporus]MCI3246495.1 hypothetical protein [Streptomyces spinosisporus]
MSGNTIANLAYLTFIAGLGATLIYLCWERKPSETERAAAAHERVGLPPVDEHDVGPDALRLLQDLDAHLNDYYARLPGLFEEVGPPDPDGIARLMKAVRDEQNKGEK